jgi:hypothetical protein
MEHGLDAGDSILAFYTGIPVPYEFGNNASSVHVLFILCLLLPRIIMKA